MKKTISVILSVVFVLAFTGCTSIVTPVHPNNNGSENGINGNNATDPNGTNGYEDPPPPPISPADLPPAPSVDVPPLWVKNVPHGVADFVGFAQTQLTGAHGEYYIGMADLLNPDGYRHIDDSGLIHPASTIKCQIMEYALLQVHAGNADVSEMIDGLTLMYLIERMIQVSCNDSTGSLIARFGRANIQSWLDVNYPDTELNSDWRGYNHNSEYNASSVRDTIAFLERVWKNRDEQPYERMLDIMFGTTFSRLKIPAVIEEFEGVKIANKTGSFIDGAKTADHDMAIVIKYGANGDIEFAYALTFYSFSQFIDEETYSAARPAIISMSLDIYERVRENHEKFALYYSENPGARP